MGSIKRAIVLFMLMALVFRDQAALIDIKTKGAKGDGTTDDGPAIMSAWAEACKSLQPSGVLIPPGTYFANPLVKLTGPCKAPIQIEATGATILAPPEVVKFKSDGWIMIGWVDKLTFSGGTFDGQGQQAWKSDQCNHNKDCVYPSNIRFDYVTNSLIKGVTSKNSKMFHVNVLGCDGTSIQHFTISAPGNSANTDGIHVGRVNGLNITDSNIGTGDDCISLGDGSKKVNVERVNCGPGHGISIGSLGRYPAEQPVEGITVKNCTLTGTMYGTRIKTWPASPANFARDIHFQDIIMNNVGSPVIINQEYCDHKNCDPKGNPSKVKLSNVSFKGIRGTSSTKEAVKLICSGGIPCDGVTLGDINLTFKGPGGPAVSVCANVKPTVAGPVVPQPCTAPRTPTSRFTRFIRPPPPFH